MPAKYILISQVDVLPGKLKQIIDICHANLKEEKEAYSIYIPYEDNSNSLLILTALDESLNYLTNINNKKHVQFDINLSGNLTSDWKLQVLKYEETVKVLENDLPTSPFLQLRHIEVPLNVYPKYLEWRKSTIFKHVLQQTKIDYFLSYHSLISTEPGVMFFSGFSCHPIEYQQIFNNPKYAEIVKEAGNQFITGGERGLYTSIYKRAT